MALLPAGPAGDATRFRHRPHKAPSLDLVLNGLAALRRAFGGAIWLKVLLLQGISDTDGHVEELVKVARRLAPDRIQLNTVARPPADAAARPVSRETLERLATRFGPTAQVIADRHDASAATLPCAAEEMLLGLLARRPCSLEDVSRALGLVVPEALKRLESLVHNGRVRVVSQGTQPFYTRAPED